MNHRSTEELEAVISRARHDVEVGGVYVHYRSEGSYIVEVLDIVLLEATDEAAVLYRASKSPNLTWVRPVSSWLEIVSDARGKQVPRFIRVREGD